MANRRTKISFVIFGYDVLVIEARDIVATGRRLNADLTGAAAAFVTRPETDPMKGWLILGPDPTIGHIAHESSHAIRAMLTAVGAELDDEVFAYHLEYLVGRIHAFLERA